MALNRTTGIHDQIMISKTKTKSTRFSFSEALNDQQDSKTSRSFKTHLKKKKA